MKILLADDDRDLVNVLRYTLQMDGHTVSTAFDGEVALLAIQSDPPDLLILDLMMPKRPGMDVLQTMQHRKKVPVIVLTALGDEDHVVKALQLGADDYLVKPFRPRELRARVQSVLRRSRERSDFQEKLLTPLEFGIVKLDPGTRQVTVAGNPVQLTRTEFSLLQYLMLNHDLVVHLADIVANVWGYEADENDEIVKVTISRLRRKVEPDPSNPCYILNVPGVGYKFESKS